MNRKNKNGLPRLIDRGEHEIYFAEPKIINITEFLKTVHPGYTAKHCYEVRSVRICEKKWKMITVHSLPAHKAKHLRMTALFKRFFYPIYTVTSILADSPLAANPGKWKCRGEIISFSETPESLPDIPATSDTDSVEILADTELAALFHRNRHTPAQYSLQRGSAFIIISLVVFGLLFMSLITRFGLAKPPTLTEETECEFKMIAVTRADSNDRDFAALLSELCILTSQNGGHIQSLTFNAAATPPIYACFSFPGSARVAPGLQTEKITFTDKNLLLAAYYPVNSEMAAARINLTREAINDEETSQLLAEIREAFKQTEVCELNSVELTPQEIILSCVIHRGQRSAFLLALLTLMETPNRMISALRLDEPYPNGYESQATVNLAFRTELAPLTRPTVIAGQTLLYEVFDKNRPLPSAQSSQTGPGYLSLAHELEADPVAIGSINETAFMRTISGKIITRRNP